MDKITNLKDLEYYSDMLLCTGLAKKWRDAKPKNQHLIKLADALVNITFYVINLKQDLETYKIASSDYRYEKNKALLELQELKTKYENLKDL